MGKDNTWECIGEHDFDGDIVITDPCYIDGNKDWEELEEFCKDRGLISQTFYGDWGCTVFKCDGEDVGDACEGDEDIGRFCADAGTVCVLDMKDALELGPDFQKFIDEHGWCATVIKGFKGKVRLMKRTERRTWKTATGPMEYENKELRVHGDGMVDGEKMSFESVQTSA